MAVFRIATIGNTKDNIFFEQAQEQIDRTIPIDEENYIEFVDITGKNKAEILEEGRINGVMYFTNSHNNPEFTETLKNLISIQDNLRNIDFFPLSHTRVTTVEQNKEKKLINKYLSEVFPEADVSATPAHITTEKEMQAYTEGIVKATALPFFDVAGPAEKETQEKLSALLKIVIDATEFKHEYTAGHVQRVSAFAEAIATELHCSEEELNDISVAAALHDIGKLVIPDSILGSSHGLSKSETKQMGIHEKAGSDLLETIAANDEGFAKILNPEVLKAVKYHHKDWDGKHDKNSDRIDPINHERIGKYACIIAVADCIDAMVSQRAYNNPKHILDTFRDLWDNRDKQFEPMAAEAAITLLGKELASLGYDPVQMFSEITENPKFKDTDQGLKDFFEENAEKFEVNRNADKDSFSTLGFRLDENGYFEFSGKNSPVRSTSIRVEDEVGFLLGKPHLIKGVPLDANISKEDLEKVARAQALKKFEAQDLEGKKAIERSRVPAKNRSVRKEIAEASIEDIGFNSTTYQETTALTRKGIRNEELQKESGVEEITNSFANVDNKLVAATGDR